MGGATAVERWGPGLETCLSCARAAERAAARYVERGERRRAASLIQAAALSRLVADRVEADDELAAPVLDALAELCDRAAAVCDDADEPLLRRACDGARDCAASARALARTLAPSG